MPDPGRAYRWRIELDCGCVHEVLTGGEDRRPTDARWRDPTHPDAALPAGQLLCWHDDETDPEPYREIAEWRARLADLPPDPAEPPAYLAHLEPEVWAKIRRDRPRAAWSVVLSCGHAANVPVADLAWEPADGPVRREVDPDELAEQLARLEEDRAQGVEVETIDHARRWWTDGCPEPFTETACFTCPSARRIVAYQPVGWLVPPRRIPGERLDGTDASAADPARNGRDG